MPDAGPTALADAEVANPDNGRVRCLWLTKGLGRGGVERLLLDMIPLVDDTRFEVEVAYILPWKDNYRPAIEAHGTVVHCLGSSRSGDPRWVGRLRRLLRERDYGLIHTHAPVPAAAARVLAGRHGSPVIIHTEHNMWDRYRTPTRLVNALTYHRNSAVIAVSATVAESVRPVPFRSSPDVSTIHHGTVLSSVRSWSDEERSRRRLELGLPRSAFVIANVGNFTTKKNHLNLLRAMATNGSIATAHLALVGLGPLEDELREACRTLGIDDRVTFLGSRDDVFDLLPLFDLFAVSSRFEGFPIALVEAMATSLPCVATAVGGIPEIIEDGTNGLLVASDEPEALAAAISRMIDEPELAKQCGVAGRESAEGLDLRQAVEAMEALYERSLATVASR